MLSLNLISKRHPNVYFRTEFKSFEQGSENSLIFTASCASAIIVVAVAAIMAPIGLKVAAVALLAGPHNFIEFRYFLSRLPARWPIGICLFFIGSFMGLALLSAAYIALMFAVYNEMLGYDFGRTLYGLWGSAVCIWTMFLVFQIERLSEAHRRPAIARARVAGLGGLALLALLNPLVFGALLVYAHPLISLAILDRELGRSRPHWRDGYRMCLALVPAVVVIFWWHLRDTHSCASDAIASHILEQTGASVMPFLSNHFLLSTLVFLDLLHYGVWLVAIPNWSAGWRRWQAKSIPLASVFPQLQNPIRLITMAALVLALLLCISFSNNYILTSQIYFVIAIMHVLAEIPYLIWASR
jgi:hypothetical protein